jgi:hypothetical protein
MKKIAFYVEGKTEQFFVNKLLIEIAGRKNIQIELQQFQGIGRPKRAIHPRSSSQPSEHNHFALILDCVGDGGVKPRILEDAANLFSQGYSEVIGLLDLYPLTDLTRFQDNLQNGSQRNGKVLSPALPSNTDIIIAVHEIESWFLEECSHFECIDTSLTNETIVREMGFNPCSDDMTQRLHPAQDLHNIYRLANKVYIDSKGQKKKNRIERTVECLDYSNIYLNLRNEVAKLGDLINKIDNFLT